MNPTDALDLTGDDRAVVATLIRHMDALADETLAADVVKISPYRALHAFVQLGNKGGWFTPSVKHQTALRRLPPEPAMRAWADQERRLSAMR
jgi:hypothetical protein